MLARVDLVGVAGGQYRARPTGNTTPVVSSILRTAVVQALLGLLRLLLHDNARLRRERQVAITAPSEDTLICGHNVAR